MKKWLSVIVAFTVLFTWIGIQGLSVKAAGSTKITIHYKKNPTSTDAWNVWLWDKDKKYNSGNGAAYKFTGTDADGYQTLSQTFPATITNLGFIIRTDAWKKDVDADRFVTQFTNGEAEIWVLSGDREFYYSKPDLSPKVDTAKFTTTTGVQVVLKNQSLASATASKFHVTGPNGDVPVTAATKVTSGAGYVWNITLGSAISLTDAYTIAVDGYGDAKSISVDSLFGSASFESAFTYAGNDLGNTYSKTETKFRVWAPTASAVDVLTYADAAASTGNAVPMTKDVNGTWIATIDGDQDGLVYNYQVHFGDTTNEAVDPYARAVTVNGDRGVVVDLDSTDPAGFSATSKPSFGKATDALIYELHIRDFSISSNSGMTNKGKYLAFTETNTVQPGTTNKTGINYLKSLGITHVELLPFFDYASVDETNLSTPQFNWGYDPKNYNAPEGSYSSDPTNPKARITELKSAIQSLHTNGLRVIMDVVYNHMFSATDSSFEKIVPGYFFRKNADGSFANGTGCGNEVASERSMARKFIVDSTKYWANEYGVDGYRFDLMGILDVQTMNQVRAELTKINPTILVIGEGWDMGNALAADKKANQKNAASMPNIAHFNDGIRDGLKGSVFDQYGAGWANGNADGFANTKAGISGGTQFATSPVQAVNYVEAHDNNTLWDKLSFTNGSTSTANKIKMDRLASSVAILAQGIPFVHAGQEFLRTKNGNENSYNAPDSVNQLDWSRTGTYKSTVDYFKGLFALRKAHPAFRMTTAAQVRTNQRFISTGKSTVIAYTLNNKANGDTWKTIAVIHNSTSGNQTVNLPSAGPWYVVANGDKAGTATLSTVKANKVTVTGYSTFVLYAK